ncbi:MAG: 5'-nucleotidase C-terminal domain-containing protein [Candidatus Lindowbacteria bacterium]|nr:5'-nucleotidase C-terminal domain-containing protein [Candidatus Lindowbacteria bacterium]
MAIGRIDLSYDRLSGILEYISDDKIFLNLDDVSQDPETKKMITKYEKTYFELVGKKLQEVIGYTEAEFTTEWDDEWNTPLGTLVCDAMRAATGADIAVEGIGGIRRTINKGPIRLKDVHDVLPFKNYLVSCEVKGLYLQGLYVFSLMTGTDTPVPYIYVSGAELNRQESGHRTEMTINGKPIDHEKTYTLVVSSYLYNQGFVDKRNTQNPRHWKIKLDEAVADYIRKETPLSPTGRKSGTIYEH